MRGRKCAQWRIRVAATTQCVWATEKGWRKFLCNWLPAYAHTFLCMYGYMRVGAMHSQLNVVFICVNTVSVWVLVICCRQMCWFTGLTYAQLPVNWLLNATVVVAIIFFSPTNLECFCDVAWFVAFGICHYRHFYGGYLVFIAEYLLFSVKWQNLHKFSAIRFVWKVVQIKLSHRDYGILQV